IDTCEVAVKVLRKQVVTATRRGNGGAAGNPAINMAAQLFAAILNVQAGAAPPCDPDLIDDALQALIDVGYNGTAVNVGKQEGSYLNALAGKLDAYNNNELVCPLYQKQ